MEQLSEKIAALIFYPLSRLNLGIRYNKAP